MKRRALFAAMMALAAPAFGQSVEFQDLISGKSALLSLTLKDLNSDWRRMTIEVKGDGKGMGLGEILGLLMQMGMMSDLGKNKGGKPDEVASAAMGMMFLSSLFGGSGEKPVYYTKGQTLSVAGETFLVAYRVKKHSPNLMEMFAQSAMEGGKEPDPARTMPGKLSAESPLVISLLNFKTIGSISDIRPFDLNKEIEESTRRGGWMEWFASEAAKQEKTKSEKPEAPDLADRAAMATFAVEDAMGSDKLLGNPRNSIRVVLKGDVVYLRGQVLSNSMKQRATSLAQQALKEAGYSYKVKNELTVRTTK